MQFLGEGDEVAKPAQIQGVNAVMVVTMFWFVRHGSLPKTRIRKGKQGAPSDQLLISGQPMRGQTPTRGLYCKKHSKVDLSQGQRPRGGLPGKSVFFTFLGATQPRAVRAQRSKTRAKRRQRYGMMSPIGPSRHFTAQNNNAAIEVTTDIDRHGP